MKRTHSVSKKKCPNPLFEKWLEEWKGEAVAANRIEMEHCFNKALKSLRKYPLKLNSGKECILLQYFGKKLCAMLDKKLEKYNKENGIVDVPNDPAPVPKPVVAQKASPKKKKQPNSNQPKNKAPTGNSSKEKETADSNFVPEWRSVEYAVLMTIYDKTKDSQYFGNFEVAPLVEYSRNKCNFAVTAADWDNKKGKKSGLNKVIEEDLVKKRGQKFSLTDQGIAVASQLFQLYDQGADQDIGNGDYPVDDAFVSLLDDSDKPCSQSTIHSPQKVNGFNYSNICGDSIEISDDEEPVIKRTRIPDSQTSSEPSSSQEPSSQPLSQPITSSQGSSDVANKKKQTSRNQNRLLSQKSKSAEEIFVPVEFAPGSFDVVLLVDTHETGHAKGKALQTVDELENSRTLYQVRSLKVGDFLWIAKHKTSNEELVLPYVVERKRMDDLARSIIDGRYAEQKFRLRQSGVDNLIYMVENLNSTHATSLPLSSCLQASVNSAVQDEFVVKFTDNNKDSMRYLALMTKVITDTHKDKTLIACQKKDMSTDNINKSILKLMRFNDFNKAGSKTRNFKVKEMFIRQLLMVKGLSLERAMVIVDKYPTPKSLIQAYKNCSQAEGEKLLGNLTFGPLKRQMGPVISKTLHQLYTEKQLK